MMNGSKEVSRTHVGDWLLVAWIVVGGLFFFRQFMDTAFVYLARLVR